MFEEMVTYKKIKDFDYLISDKGDILSLKSGIKTLNPSKNSNGYLYQCLRSGGKRKNIAIHRLVASTFIGNIDGKEINHKDYNKHNNLLSNLETCSRSENAAHMKRRENKIRGIYFRKDLIKKPWQAQISFKGKNYFIGRFSAKELAYESYFLKYKELTGVEPWPI